MKKIALLIILTTNFIYSQTLVKTYYDPLFKTKLKEVYQVKKNTPIANGYYKAYDKYGNILMHKNYLNNKLNGKSTTYIGLDEASVTYGGEKSLGKIAIISNYKNDKLNGQQLRYNFNTKGERYLEFKQNYVNDKLTSSTIYFPNGQEKKIIKIGKCYEYYENGQKFAEYIVSSEEVIDGEYLGWYETGQLQIKGFFKNGQKDNEWIEYNEDGSVKSKKTFDLGKKVLTEYEKSIIEKERVELENKKIAEQTRREQEQKEIERQRKLKIKKRNEKIRLKEENERKEKEKIRKLEEKEKKVANKIIEYEKGCKVIVDKYKVVDHIATTLIGETVYKYKKKKLFKSYQIASTYISSKLNSDNITIKNDFADLGLSLIEKMKNLRNQNTKKLEKELKKVEDPERILKIILGK